MSLDPRLAAHAVMDAGDAIVTLDQNAKVTSWNRAAEQLWGPAAEALGLAPGQQIERESYELLFVQRKAPDGTPLGRPPGRNTKAAEIYARLPAAEAPATPERKWRAPDSLGTRQGASGSIALVAASPEKTTTQPDFPMAVDNLAKSEYQASR